MQNISKTKQDIEKMHLIFSFYFVELYKNQVLNNS